MIDSNKYEQKTPEWTLAKFLESWKGRNWEKMLDYCQISWLSLYKEPKKIINTRFHQKLLDAEILKIEEISEVTRDISIKIRIKNINIVKKLKRKARLICEKGVMQPSINGKWGVNPTSMGYER